MTTLQLYQVIDTTTGLPVGGPGPVGHPALNWEVSDRCAALNAANPDPERYRVVPYIRSAIAAIVIR